MDRKNTAQVVLRITNNAPQRLEFKRREVFPLDWSGCVYEAFTDALAGQEVWMQGGAYLTLCKRGKILASLKAMQKSFAAIGATLEVEIYCERADLHEVVIVDELLAALDKRGNAYFADLVKERAKARKAFLKAKRREQR